MKPPTLTEKILIDMDVHSHLRSWLLSLFAVLWLVPQAVCAQEFLEVNWDELQIDSLLPCYTHSIPLEGDFDCYDYQVAVEYPEFAPVTAVQRRSLDAMKAVLPAIPQVDSYVEVSAKQGALYVSLVPVVCRDGDYQRLTSFKLAVSRRLRAAASASQTRAATIPLEERYADSSVLAAGKWVKIRLQQTGVYRLTHSQLRSMGFQHPERVRLYGHGGQMMAEKNIQDCIDDLKEVPLYRRSADMLFYAHGTVTWRRSGSRFVHSQHTYSSHAYYFLTEDASTAPMEFPVQESLPGGATVSTFPDYALYEKDLFSWMHRGRLFFDDDDFKNGRTKKYQFDLPGVVEGNASVTVAFGGNDPQANTLSVSVGEKVVGTMTMQPVSASSYTKFHTKESSFDCTGSLSGRSLVTLSHSGDASGYLDYIRINYTRSLRLDDAFTCFRPAASGQSRFAVAGADSHTAVWKISDRGPQGYACTEVKGEYGDALYTIGDKASLTDEYVAVNTAATTGFLSAEVVGNVSNQNLHGLGPVDMVIVVPASAKWISQAERLAQLHRHYDSLRVVVVRADEIYNEFSSGTPDATAIRRFMKMFYDRAVTVDDLPKHLLLFADCSADNRMLTNEWKRSDPNDFLPCFQSELSSSETRSFVMEEYFCLLDDNEGTNWTSAKSDAAVGRLTVRSLAQATVVVDKIEAYISNRETGVWRNKVCMLADDGPTENDFNDYAGYADGLADDINGYAPGIQVEKIYWDAHLREINSTGARYPTVEKRLRELAVEGALMMNYSGHGRAESLSHEYAWTLESMTVSSSLRLPLWIMAACDTAPIDLPEDNMGEAALLNSGGGGIAALGTTRSTYGPQSNRLNEAFTRNLLRDGMTLGEALRQAKNASILASNVENNLHYVLIGDPALRLAVPRNYAVKVTALNGRPIDKDHLQTLKAGSLVTVDGCVVDRAGRVVNDFTGSVYPAVFDTREQVTCLMNNSDVATEAFQYWDYTKKLYAGSDSVHGGKFSFTFPVPLEISYTDEAGAIFFYVQDEESLAGNGVFADFLIGGTSEGLQNDSIGPTIEVLLNGNNSGGKVHETPLLQLHLYDADGINTSGNGVGHDLVAIIDNDPNMTYVLNSYYTSKPGYYTAGTVTYSLPAMEPGKHTMLVRAWDVLNNSSTVEVAFEVVKGRRPTLAEVWCTESPARTATTFVIRHDRPQSELAVRLEVFDFAGRLLWQYAANTTSTGNLTLVPWDLTTTDGQPVGNGVYLYRATISAVGGSESTKTRKIVVSRQ